MFDTEFTFLRIKQRTKALGKTLEGLSADIGIGKNTLRRSAESTTGLSAAILYDCAVELDCTVDYLLGLTDNCHSSQIMENPDARSLTPEECAIVNNEIERDAIPVYSGKKWEELKAFIKSIPATKHPSLYYSEHDIEFAKMISGGIMCKMLEIENRGDCL